MGREYPDVQYVDVSIGGNSRRVAMRISVFADGTIQRTYWSNGLMVTPDFEPDLDEFQLIGHRTTSGLLVGGGHGRGCGCNTCQPAPACDPCATPPIISPTPVYAGVVSGVARIGQQLVYDAAVWHGAMTATAYWYRGSVRMHSAKIPYTLTEADRGFFISVLETGIGMGTMGTNPIRSNLIGPIGDASGEVPTQVYTQPLISGTAVVGANLVYTRGVWVGAPTPDVQGYWQRGDGVNWADIGPANTGLPYIVTETDVGFRLRVKEVARNTASLITALSNLTDVVQATTPVAPSVTQAPVIMGDPTVGSQVAYSAGLWTGSPAPLVTARWFANAVDLGPAVAGGMFTIPPSALNAQLRVQETANSTAGVRVTQSNSIGPIAPAATPPMNSYPPSVAGNAMVGQSISYVPGTWSGVPTPTISAVWQQEVGGVWSAVGVATAGVGLPLVTGNTGNRFRVLETAVGSSTASLASAAVGPVVPAATVPPAVVTTPVISGSTVEGGSISYVAGVWSGSPAPALTPVWQRRVGAGAWTTIGPATTGTPYQTVAADVGATIRIWETATGSSVTNAPSNTLGPITAAEPEGLTVYSFDSAVNTWEVRPTGTAAGANARTFRPFLPWNHQGTAAAFAPINNCPQVYVFPQMLGTDNQPLGVNPFSAAPDGALRITSAIASPAVQSKIIWPGSASAATGYRTSGSLSLMGLMQAQYGRFRARMRFTETLGFWPEMWIVPAWGEGADFEIDAEFNTSRPGSVSFNAFKTNFANGTTEGWVMANAAQIWLDMQGGATINDFVDYEFHWTKDFIRFYVNGTLMREITDHGFHTPGTVLFSFASGNGVAGWQELPAVGTTIDPAYYDIKEIEWTQSPADVLNMPVQVSRPTVGSPSGGTVTSGSVVTVTPAVVTGGTLLKREWMLGRHVIPGLTGLTVTLPANIDDYTDLAAGAWIPFNVLETYTNPQGGITLARSSDVLYRVVGQPPAPSSNWVVDQERIASQDIGGAEWYKYGITMVGNVVTETATSGEHGVGLSGMQRDAGAIRIKCEAVVSGVTGHTQLQMQVAPGDWSRGAFALFEMAGGVGAEGENGWTVVSHTHEELGGGQHRLTMIVDVDATTIGFTWLLRGYVGGMASYAGSTSRGFNLVSSSIERVAGGSTPPAPPPAGPTSDWVQDVERIASQDIGGAEWYKTGVTATGNAVVETATTSEHGVGLSGMPRAAGEILIQCEAIVSGITGHDNLQFQVASGDWAFGANVVFSVAGGVVSSGNSGWSPMGSSAEDLGGGQLKLMMVVSVDPASTGFVWILRGYVGGTANYLGAASRGFTLVSSSIKRVG